MRILKWHFKILNGAGGIRGSGVHPLIERRQRRLRVARPRAKHRPGREATSSDTIRVQLAQSPPFREMRKCGGPDTIGRGWCSFLSFRDPAALRAFGSAGPPDRFAAEGTRDDPQLQWE